jgi:uncharacterized protein YecE (DUF72 family)
MKFGKAENLEDTEFLLPDDHEATEKLFASLKKKSRSKKKAVKVYVGCAKWGIPEWVGKIYPPGTYEKDFREYYLKQYNSIELNPTHYRTPSAEQVKNWKGGAAKDFKFCPKFPQVISHMKRLKDCGAETDRFFKAIENFGSNLGTSFLQLPPNYPPKNFAHLEKYVSSLPKEFDICVELRHPLWFSDEKISDETFTMLKENKTGAVITDTAGRRDLVHTRLTTPTAFIRYVGNNLHPSDFKRINDWTSKLKRWIDSGIETVYFLMHMHDEKDSPELTDYVIRKLNKECKLNLKPPKFYNGYKGKRV